MAEPQIAPWAASGEWKCGTGTPLDCSSCWSDVPRATHSDARLAHPPGNTVLVLVRSLTSLRLSSAAYVNSHK